MIGSRSCVQHCSMECVVVFLPVSQHRLCVLGWTMKPGDARERLLELLLRLLVLLCGALGWGGLVWGIQKTNWACCSWVVGP